MTKKIIVATRPSQLAVMQTGQIVAEIIKANPEFEFEIVEFKTEGDRVTGIPLTSFGGTGVFVKELEVALLEKRADFAVHSLKDVPGFVTEGLELVSFPIRENPCDVIWTKNGVDLSELPKGFILGTGSPRRIIQLLTLRPDAKVADLRGNINTRLDKLESGQYDAIVLAAAGLNRFGKKYPVSGVLPVEKCIPAIGQGALALQCRSNDNVVREILSKVNDCNTEIAVKAERAYMKEIEGGCKFPLAAYAHVLYGYVYLVVMAGDQKTNKMIRLREKSLPGDAVEMGIRLAVEMKARCSEAGIVLGA